MDQNNLAGLVVSERRAARREALEDAAKVVENYGSQVMPDQLTDEVMKIAAAVRALKE